MSSASSGHYEEVPINSCRFKISSSIYDEVIPCLMSIKENIYSFSKEYYFPVWDKVYLAAMIIRKSLPLEKVTLH